MEVEDPLPRKTVLIHRNEKCDRQMLGAHGPTVKKPQHKDFTT